MAKGTELANAYVTLIPSLDGAQKRIEADLAKVDVTGAGKKIGRKLGDAAGKAAGDDASDGIEKGVEKTDTKSSGRKLGTQLGSAMTDALHGSFDASSVTDMLGGVVPDSVSEKLGGLGETGSKALGLITTAAPIAGAAVAAIGAVAIDAAADFDAAEARITAAVGGVGEEADALKEAGRTLYEDGWGESMTDLADSLINAREILGDINEEDMSGAVEAALALEQTYGSDFSETLRGARVLMERFGLSSEEAMDLMVAGTQRGLDYTDELGDNLSEYAGRWADAGIEASEYFSLLEAGASGGAYQLDKVGDFLNEFLTSLTDGRMEEGIGHFSEGTQKVFESFKSGGADARDVLDAVVGELAKMPDGYEKAQIASELWSSLGEDNAMSMIESLAGVEDTFSDVAGASKEMTDQVSSDLGSRWETACRKWQSLLEPVGSVFVDIASAGADAFGGLAEGIGDLIDWTTRAGDEAQTQAEAMKVLADASTVAGESMEQASEAPRMLGTEIYNLGEEIQENWQAIAGLGTAFDEIDAKASAQVTQLGSAKDAIADYNGQADLSTQQLGSFRAAIETVNAQCGTNYEVVKDAGGAYHVMRDGAKVAADELYELIDAQIAQVQVSAQMDKLESLYAEQAEQASEYAEAVKQVAEAQEAYDDALAKYGENGSNWALNTLNEAKENLAEVEKQMGATAEATEATEESIGNLTAAATGAVEGFDALVQGSGSLNTFFAEAGGSMDEFADDLEASGVSLETFATMGQDDLLRLAASWDGTEESVTSALDEMGVSVEEYNAVDLADKEASTTVDDMDLWDAQGKLYTWNGSELVDQNGVAVVDDISLNDAQGNVWVWNGSRLVPLSTTAQVTGNVPSGQAKRSIDDTNASTRAMTSRTVNDTVRGSALTAGPSIWDTVSAIGSLRSKTVTVTTKINNLAASLGASIFNAAGGMRLNAAGGIAPRFHADGAIATRAVPLDIVGEDGAEAIVPLTNRRYSQPFADVIAEGVSRRITAGTTNVYVDGSLVAVDSRIAQAVAALLGAVERRYDMGGVRA